ncbi:MAG: sugar phosphate nucleotidyltransferase [Elusimicrobiaceae bacterium]
MQAIILAGGKGTRLKPFTASIPKPLMPIDDMPILEIVLKQLRRAGFTDIVITVNHMAELIMAFFGDGAKLGLNIIYSREDSPLGTAGPLGLIKKLDDNFLVMNGDLLTTLDYRDLHSFHVKNNSAATVSTYTKETKIDLGVLKIENGELKDYIEKPVYTFDVSMGIYMFNRKIMPYIPANAFFNMPDLILKLRGQEKIMCYKKDYYWLDIGRVSDYETAVEIFKDRKAEFLP